MQIKILLITQDNILKNSFSIFFAKKDKVIFRCQNEIENILDIDFILIDEMVLSYSEMINNLASIKENSRNHIGIIILSNQVNIKRYISYFKNKVILITNRISHTNNDFLLMLFHQIMSIFDCITISSKYIFEAQNLKLNIITQQIYINNIIIREITNNEFSILKILFKYKNQLVLKERIFQEIFEDRVLKTEMRMVDSIICSIRRKLRKYSNTDYIVTLWRKGYYVKD